MLLKLAILGGIGYCVYQAFYADRTDVAPPRPAVRRSEFARVVPQRSPTPASQPLMSGPGTGTTEVLVTSSGGATTRHKVGRGVV